MKQKESGLHFKNVLKIFFNRWIRL